MKTTALLAFIVLPLLGYAVETVTLFDLSFAGEPTGGINSHTLSLAGVGPNGATTYVEEVVASIVFINNPSGQIMTTIPPQTIHETIVEDASGYLISDVPTTTHDIGVVETCSFGAGGNGKCVAKFIDGDLSSSLSTSSWSGTVVPVYTLTVSGKIAAASSSSPSSTGPISPTSSSASSGSGGKSPNGAAKYDLTKALTLAGLAAILGFLNW